MSILQVLGLLQLLALPAFTLTQPVHDYWGEFGAYGPCSRTCGTGVATRTRKCISSRTDGGHNCLGSSKSFRVCNTQACPAGSKDFREEQCAHFDRIPFQGKHQTWVPYYGATNPCELNCVPSGQNFFYRHKPAVIDGTKCYVGRSDICADGICRTYTHTDFMGLDEDNNAVQSTVPVSAPVVSRPRDTHTYQYKIGVYGQCSASCNGGMQYRSVTCWLQDPSNPRVVDETYCINQRLQRPQSQQACNMHACAAEYRVSSFSVCSVTCGEGQQTREVTCVGAAGERLSDHACSSLVQPASVQTCRRPACPAHISWHVTEFGLCTRSCGGGVRERRVSCYDGNLSPYPEERCGLAVRPVSVEACNSQPCSQAQLVPSVQNPRASGSTVTGYVPHVSRDPSASRPDTNVAREHYPPVVDPFCAQSLYGCCPDGHTSANGPRNEGCSHSDCVRSRHGCCLDGVTLAQGFGRAGCPEYQTAVENLPSSQPSRSSPSSPSSPFSGDVCSLPRDEGSCDTWKVRFYYDSATNKCTEFWYGSCLGNANNFQTLAACQAECGGVVREPAATPRRATPRRGATRSARRATA